MWWPKQVVLQRQLIQLKTTSAGQHVVAGVLVGTHAHEVVSIAAQLLARYDDEAGGGPDSPVPVSAVVAHLLFIACNGGAEAAVALADTFGTQAFLAVALAADVPQEFLDDLRQRYPDAPQPQPGEPPSAVGLLSCNIFQRLCAPERRLSISLTDRCC